MSELTPTLDKVSKAVTGRFPNQGQTNLKKKEKKTDTNTHIQYTYTET